MKKIIIASLALFAAASYPAFGQNADTAGDASQDIQFKAPVDQGIAAIPSAVTPPSDAIAIGAGPGAGVDMNLSDEQLEKIAKIKNDFADAIGPKRLQASSLNRQLRTLMSQEKVDRSAILDIQKKINDLNGDLATSKLSMKLDTLNVLTPEQRQKMHHKQLQRLVFSGGKGGERRHGGMHQGGHMYKRSRGPEFRKGQQAPQNDEPKADIPGAPQV